MIATRAFSMRSFGVACGLFVVVATNSLAATAPALEMRMENGAVSAEISGIQLRQVMERFGELTGARIAWHVDDAEEAVSVHLTRVSPAEAIARLLRGRNYMVRRVGSSGTLQITVGSRTSLGGDRRVAGVIVASGSAALARGNASLGTAAASVSEEALPTGPDEVTEHFREDAIANATGQGRIEAIRQLGNAADAPATKATLARLLATDADARVRRSALIALAGAEAVPVDVLIAATQNDRDPRIRREALSLLARVAEEDTLRETLGQAVGDDAHPRLRRMARRLGNRPVR
jgi:hypothetical protein